MRNRTSPKYGSAYALWLDGDTQDKLRKIATDRKTTMARVVREFIIQGLEREGVS